MPPKCTVCASKKRYQVDKLIVSGATNRAISRQFPEFSKDSIRRHRNGGHVADLIEDSQDKEARRQGLELSSLLEDTVRDLRDLADDARSHEDYKAAATALGHVLRAAEIISKGKQDDSDDYESDDYLKALKSAAKNAWPKEARPVQMEAPESQTVAGDDLVAPLE